jgi:hypothetical protein
MAVLFEQSSLRRSGMGSITVLISIVIGVVALLYGRRLFWLFVGIIGFAVGFTLAQVFLGGNSDWNHLLIALAVGVLGSWLAVGLQKLAVSVAGFAAGGYLLAYLFGIFKFTLPVYIPWLIGGIFGAILISRMFELALIGFSAGIGAAILTHSLPLLGSYELLQFLILLVIGIFFQTPAFRKRM